MWYCKSKDLIAGLQYSSFATSRWYQVLQYSLKDKNMQPRFIKCFSITMVFIQATDPSTESKITQIKFSSHFSNTINGHIYYLTKTHIWSLAFFLKVFIIPIYTTKLQLHLSLFLDRAHDLQGILNQILFFLELFVFNTS